MGGVTLRIGGSPLDPALATCLSEIEVRQALNAPSLALLTFLDPPAEATGSIAIGVPISISDPDGRPMFEGEVTAVKRTLGGARERSLSIRAYDALHRLRKRQTLRNLSGIGLSELASQVAADLGVEVDGSEAPQPRAIVIQHRQSDFDLLSELSAAAGLCFWLEGSVLRLLTLGGNGGEEIRLTPGGNVLEITTDVTAEPMRKSSRAFGWNIASNEVLSGEAGMSSQDALEMRLDAVAAFEGYGDRYLVNRVCDSADEVRRLAQSDIDRATARGLQVDALCEGDARLRPGQVVRLEGMGSEVDGPFVVSSAVHRADALSGYTTRLGTDAPAGLRSDRPCPAVTLGVVTDTNDPERKSRVKARLPTFGDVEGDWMPVLSIGAGRTKGFTVIPEPNDEILVLMPDGDPARAIVLGGLYGSSAAPGERPAEGARAFVVRSPSGPQLTLDGSKALVRIESGDGEILEIGPDGTLFRSARDMTIEAPGRTIKIRAARVDFETA